MENELVIAPASESDIPEIRLIARETFYPTYRDILSPEQLDYMYEWMYSAESLSRQMHSGHRFFIARDKSGNGVGYVSIEQQGERLVHLQKSMSAPTSRGFMPGGR